MKPTAWSHSGIIGGGLLAIAGMASSLPAADFTWNGAVGTGSLDWNTATNWSPNGTPSGTGQYDVINTNITVTQTIFLNGTQTVGRLDVGDTDKSHSFVIAAGSGGILNFDAGTGTAQYNQLSTSKGDTVSAPVTLSSDLAILNSSTNVLTFSGSVSAASTGTKTIANQGTGTGGVTISGNISDGGGGVVAVTQNSSSSTLTLSGSNTFTGGLNLFSGTVLVTADKNLGGAANALTFNGGALGLNVAGGTFGTGRTATVNAGGGTVLIPGGNYNTNYFAANIDGVGALTLYGNNSRLILSGTNSYQGGTVINTGRVQFNSAASLPSTGTIQINNGALNVAGAYTTVMGWLGSGKIATTGSGAIALTANSSENIDMTGYSNLTLGAAENDVTYTGSLTPANGTYRLGGGGKILSLTNNNALTGTNSLMVGNGTTNGQGTLLLSGSNDFTGGTVLTYGHRLTLQNGNGLGTGSVTVQTGELQFQNAGTVANNVFVSGDPSGVSGLGKGVLRSFSGTTIMTGTVALLGATRFSTDDAVNSLTFNGPLVTNNLGLSIDTGTNGAVAINGAITGVGGITKNSAGTLTLSASNTTYYGGITLNATSGKLTLANGNAAGFGNLTVLSTTANVLSFASGIGTFYVGALTSGAGTNIVLADTASNPITLNAGSSGFSTTVTGILSGAGSLVKSGTGTMTLLGASSYTGATSVKGGALALTSSVTSGSPFGTGTLTVDGGTLSLAPAGSGSAVAYTGANAAADTQFVYGAAVLALAKGTQTSLTYTLGNAGATGSVLARSGNGTLIVKTSTSGTLGVTEVVKLNGTAPAITNGMVNASIVGQNVGTMNQGDFLTYDSANGFVTSTSYTARSGVIAAGATGATEITNITAASSISSNTTYALRVGAFTATVAAASTLQVGDNTAGHQAGVILNGGTIAAGDATSKLDFGAAEGVVYSFSSSGAVNAAIAGTGGVTVSGSQPVVFGGSNTFSGGLAVNGGTLRFSSDANLGDAANAVTLNNNAALASTAMVTTNRSFVIGSGGATLAGTGLNLGGNITGSGQLTVLTSTVLLSGSNSYSGPTSLGLSGGPRLMISSDANLGGTSNLLAMATMGGQTLSILGTQLTTFGARPVTFGTISNNGSLGTFEIQDPSNVFNFNVNNYYNMNSANNNATMTGQGTLRITTLQTGWSSTTGVSISFNGGTFLVDEAAGGHLTQNLPYIGFGGGTYYLLGKTNTSVALSSSTVKVNAGGGNVVVDNNNGSGTTTMNLGALNTFGANGASLNIATINHGSGAAVATSTSANDASGIVGIGRVTYTPAGGTTGFATIVSGSTLGAYAGATAFVTSGASSAVNYKLDGSAAGVSTETVNTLGIGTTATGQSLTQLATTTLTMATGALLFTGSHDYTISGGALASTSGVAPDIILHQYGTGVLTISSALVNSGTGASTLTKDGSGKVVLTSSNGYNGQTYINGGILAVSAGNQLGSGSPQVNINGGTLQVLATTTFGNKMAMGGSGGTFDILNSATVNLNTTAVVSGAGVTVDSSDGSGGTLIINGASTFSSGLWINGGIVRLNNAAAIPTTGFNTLSFGSAATETLQLNGFNAFVAGLKSSGTAAVVENINSSTAATLTVNQGDDETYSGVLRDGGSASLSLVKWGGGTLTLSGANTYTGSTMIGNGVLKIGGAAGAVAGNVTNNAVLEFARSTDYTYAGIVSGTGAVRQTGAGVLTLSGSNSYTGGTLVTGGTLKSGNANAFGTAGIAMNAGTLDLRDANVANVITITGTGVSVLLPSSTGALASNFAAGSSLRGWQRQSGTAANSTLAQLLGGTTGGAATITSSWSASTNTSTIVSDVLDLKGINGTTFVLQMNYADSGNGSTWENDNAYLGWLDPNSSAWVNAVLGNNNGTGTLGTHYTAAYDPNFAYSLGDWGVDATNNVVWAVVNHNSEFAVVVPEPAMLALLGLGSLALLRRKAGRG